MPRSPSSAAGSVPSVVPPYHPPGRAGHPGHGHPGHEYPSHEYPGHGQSGHGSRGPNTAGRPGRRVWGRSRAPVFPPPEVFPPPAAFPPAQQFPPPLPTPRRADHRPQDRRPGTPLDPARAVPAAPSIRERRLAVGVHLCAVAAIPLVLTPLAPLACRAAATPGSFVHANATAATNFSLTMWLFILVLAPATLVVIGWWFLIPVVFVAMVLGHLMAAGRAGAGHVPRYPLTIPFFR